MVRRRHVLTLSAVPPAALGEQLSATGGTLIDPWTWVMPDGLDLDLLRADLDRRGLASEISFRFEPEPGEPANRLAAYLPVAELDAVTTRGTGPLLAWDQAAQAIVGNRAAAQALAASTIEWIGGGDLRAARVSTLPEPVMIDTLLEAVEGSKAWLIRSDGREYLSEAALSFVDRRGIVDAPYCQVGEDLRRWVRPWIVSGSVLALIDPSRWVGPLAPSYLAVRPTVS